MSEAMVFSQKGVQSLFLVGNEQLLQVEDLKYLWPFKFMSRGRQEQEA